MTDARAPLTGRHNAAPGGTSPDRDAPPLHHVIENIARLIDRIHPPSRVDTPVGLVGTSANLRAQLGHNDTAVASLAISGLKELLHEIESLRERADYLDTASAKAYAELNSTEHRLHEINSHQRRVWSTLSATPLFDDHARETLDDSTADPEERLLALQHALEKALKQDAASPKAEAGLASQVASLRAKAAALRKDHGKGHEDAAKHQADIDRLKAEHANSLEYVRRQHESDRADNQQLTADLRRSLALLEAEREKLKAALAEFTPPDEDRLIALIDTTQWVPPDDTFLDEEATNRIKELESDLRAARDLAKRQESTLRARIAELENQQSASGELNIANQFTGDAATTIKDLQRRLNDSQQALVGADNADKMIDDLQQELTDLKENGGSTEDDAVIARMDAQISDLEALLAQANDTIAELQTQAQSAKDAAVAVEPPATVDTSTLHQDIERLQLDIATLEARLSEANAELLTARSELAQSHADLTSATDVQTQLSTIQSELATAQTELATAQTELAAAYTELATTQAEHTQSRTELANRDDLIGELRATLEQNRSELSTLQASEKTVDDVERIRRALAEQLDQVESERIADQQRHAVALETIHADLSAAEDALHACEIERDDTLSLTNQRAQTIAALLHHLAKICAQAQVHLDAGSERDALARVQHQLTTAVAAITADDAEACDDATAIADRAYDALIAAHTHITTALHHGADAERERDDLRQQAQRAQRDIEELSSRAKDAEIAASTTGEASRLAQIAIDHAKTAHQRQADALQEQLTTSQRECAEYYDQLTHAQQILIAAQQSAQQALSAATDTNLAQVAQLTLTTSELTQAHQQLARIQAQLHEIVADSTSETDAIDTLIEACTAELDEVRTGMATASHSAATSQEQLRAERLALTQQIAQLEADLQTTRDHLATATSNGAAHEARTHSLDQDMRQTRTALNERDHQLSDLRSQLATIESDLATAREHIQERDQRLADADQLRDELHTSQHQVEAAARDVSSAEERTATLLTAIKNLGHVVNAAGDRVGVGLPAASKHLTRTTARIERAELGAELIVACENARTVCSRAADQCDALATVVEQERRRRDAIERDQAELTQRAAKMDTRIAELTIAVADAEHLRTDLASSISERDRLAAELRASAEALGAAQTLAERQARIARADIDEHQARTGAAQAEIRELDERLKVSDHAIAKAVAEARETYEFQLVELQAAIAEAEGRVESVNVALDERETIIARLQADMDAARAGNSEVIGYQARIRTLSSKLAEAVGDVEHLRAERGRDHDRMAAATDAEARLAGMEAEFNAALHTRRNAETALAEAKAQQADAARHLQRLERDWKRRLAAAQEALSDERDSLARTTAECATLRGELAAIKTRRTS